MERAVIVPGCSKILRSGKRCKNKAKYGNYCGVHKDNDKGFPLLELHDDIINNIIQCIIDPKDLKNFASVSLRIQFFVACHTERMIKYELPLDNLFTYNSFIARVDIRQYLQKRALEIKKWNYILFLAIGGLYIKFKPAGTKFYFNNFIVTTYISQQWKMFRTKRSNYSDTSCILTRTQNVRVKANLENNDVILPVRVVFGINVKKMTPTSSYNSTFETTSLEEMEHFFWKQFK